MPRSSGRPSRARLSRSTALLPAPGCLSRGSRTVLLVEDRGRLRTAAGRSNPIALARELQLDPDLLLAMAGKVSSELQTIIRKRPQLFADFIRALKDQPDHAVLRVVREVRDGNW